MLVNECMSAASFMLGLDNVTMDSNTKKKLNKTLFTCASHVLDMIISDYRPIKDECEVYASDGIIEYSSIGNVIEILEITRDGKKVDFETLPMNIHLSDNTPGTYKVTSYLRFLPITELDTVPDSLGLSARTIAYGIAAEYLLVNGFYEESLTFDKMFKDSLNRFAFGRQERKVKERRWLT